MFKTFRENRRLVRDLRTADAVHMQTLDEISDLKKRAVKAETSLDESRQVVAQLTEDLTKLEGKLREQNGADLLVNALRELGVLPKPDKYDSFLQEKRLMAARQQLGSQQAAQSGQFGQSHPGQSLMGSIFGGP